MQLVLQLLLGCAVQCPNKQVFIERIKELPIDAQHALVDCIKQVTESQEIVLTPDAADVVSTEQLLKHLRRLLKVRDQLLLINELKTEARVGKAYRDEADALRERAERADRLEAEVLRYREKLSDLEYYR
ncbi:unnamed protein product, partial [Nesidiocoris tenuis]